jgi:hypothetical protein
MDRFEDAVREALRREDPGPDFTGRVLVQAATASASKPWSWLRLASAFRPVRVRWAAAGALACILLAAGGVTYHERQTRIEGEAARQQLVLALRIAGTKLNWARAKVAQLNGEL